MKNKILTIPNILTIIRLFLAPIFVFVFVYVDKNYALLIFLFAGITDIVDGYLARKFDWGSDLGKILDPLADKIMRIFVLTMLVIDGALPSAILIILLIFDLFLVLTSAYLYNKNFVVSSNIYGKLAAVVLTLGLVLSFFDNSISPFHLIVMYAGILLVALSIVIYVVRVREQRSKLLEANKE